MFGSSSQAQLGKHPREKLLSQEALRFSAGGLQEYHCWGRGEAAMCPGAVRPGFLGIKSNSRCQRCLRQGATKGPLQTVTRSQEAPLEGACWPHSSSCSHRAQTLCTTGSAGTIHSALEKAFSFSYFFAPVQLSCSAM